MLSIKVQSSPTVSYITPTLCSGGNGSYPEKLLSSLKICLYDVCFTADHNKFRHENHILKRYSIAWGLRRSKHMMEHEKSLIHIMSKIDLQHLLKRKKRFLCMNFSLHRSTLTLHQNTPIIHYIHKQEPTGILTQHLHGTLNIRKTQYQYTPS